MLLSEFFSHCGLLSIVKGGDDFEYRDGGCFLNDTGRKKYLRAFLQRMEEPIQTESGEQPRWDTLVQQVRAFKRSIYDPSIPYKPYTIR
jgi:CRISP-associated protein Cas1